MRIAIIDNNPDRLGALCAQLKGRLDLVVRGFSSIDSDTFIEYSPALTILHFNNPETDQILNGHFPRHNSRFVFFSGGFSAGITSEDGDVFVSQEHLFSVVPLIESLSQGGDIDN